MSTQKKSWRRNYKRELEAVRMKPKTKVVQSLTATPESKVLAARLIDDVPANWIDPLLTGRHAVINHNKKCFTCADIERILNGLRARMEKTAGYESKN